MKLFFAVQNITEPDYGYSYANNNLTKLYGHHLDHTHQTLFAKVILWKLKQTNEEVYDERFADACVAFDRLVKCRHLNICKNKLIVLISKKYAGDDDDRTESTKCCSNHTLRIVGNRRFLLNKHCDDNYNTIDVPYASHIHSWIPEAASFQRSNKLVMAANTVNHNQMKQFGFDIWRNMVIKYLRTNNYKLIMPFGRGFMMPRIVDMYSKSIFCINPPGDDLARTAIIDSLALGCIPVLLHSQQSNLWKHFWNSSDCAINLSWELKNNSERISSLESLYHLSDIPQRRSNCIRQTKYLVYDKENTSDAIHILNKIIKERLVL